VAEGGAGDEGAGDEGGTERAPVTAVPVAAALRPLSVSASAITIPTAASTLVATTAPDRKLISSIRA
jgi:hypothetical protein